MPVSSAYHTSLLKVVNRYFEAQGYRLVHQHRLSKQSFMSKALYHGLTQVELKQHKGVIKWQLQDLAEGHLQPPIKAHSDTPLAIEIQHLQHIAAMCDCHVLKLSNRPCCVPLIQKIYTTQLIIEGRRWQLMGFRMPYYQHGSVKAYLKRHSLSEAQKLQLIQALAQSVFKLHQLGWVHADIKPSNFLLADNNLSLNAAKQPKQNKHNEFNHLSIVITDVAYAIKIDNQIDDVKRDYHPRGTAAYLAPECWQGHPVSIQSDIYAFGVMVYEILMGVKPFQITKDSDVQSLSTEWAVAHCQAEVPLLSKQWLYLQPIIDKLLAKRLPNRFTSMKPVIEALLES